MERMPSAQSLRCDIVRPFSENLGKPPAKDFVTELDAKLAANLNNTSLGASPKRYLSHARDFTMYN